MRPPAWIAAIALVLAGCGGGDSGSPPTVADNHLAGSANGAAPAQAARLTRWDLQSSGEGTALVLVPMPSGVDIRLFCPAGANRLLVNVPAFRPIGSEERLSFGGGGEVVTLVADTAGDRQRGGVSATGDVPENLAALLRGPLSASYGAQRSGPHPGPPPEMVRTFTASCRQRPAATPPPRTSAGGSAVSACLMQGSERLRVAPLRAVGTEPFWGARIEGRCVTYSHPDDQAGTRVWTRYTAGAGGGGTWSGALGGRAFELRTHPQPGCSDGMSDKRYPLAVELLVSGERRRGCAEPL